MRFTVDTNEMNEAVSVVTKAMPAHSSLPILEGIYIYAGNGNLYLDVDPSASSKLKLPIEAGPDANPLIATIKLRTDI